MGDLRVFIESVRLHNFLSFYEGVVKLDPGLTVVVGANGSGKTSIFQAIKFALGSNQRDERYPKWRDFVRHGASSAEVEVTVQVNGQSRHLLRKIDRRGNPQAYIDGKRVKAAELRQLATSFQFDVDNSLIFMPQEKINSIRGLNPIAVRMLIEEGTGLHILRDRIGIQESRVTLSRQKLEETLRESQTVGKELEHIKKDLERLEKKRILQKQEKELVIEARWARLEDIDTQIRSVKSSIEEKEHGLVDILEKEKHLNTKQESKEEEIAEIQERIDSLQEEIWEIKTKITDKEKELEKMKSQDKMAVDELRQSEKLLKQDERELKKFQSDLRRFSDQREKLMEQREVHSEGLQKQEKELDEIEKELDAFAEWNRKRAEVHSMFKSLQVEIKGKDFLLRSLMERLRHEEADLQGIDRKWEGVWSALEDADEKALQRKLIGIEREHSSLNEERVRESSKLSEAKKKIEHIRLQLTEREKRVPEEVRKLSEAISEHRLSTVFGPIADLVSGDNEYSELLEAIFPGDMIFAFIVTDENDSTLIQKLRNSLGAPSPIIMPEESIRTIDTSEAPQGKTVIGWLWDLLQLDPDLTDVFRSTLGEYVVVKDSNAAIRIANKTGLSVVSVDGHVITQQKTCTVSLPKIEPSGIITTAPLQAQLDQTESQSRIISKRITEIMRRLEKLESEREEIRTLLSQIRSWSEIWERRRVLSESIPELQERVAQVDSEIIDHQREMGKRERELRALDDAQPPERSRLMNMQNAIRMKIRKLNRELTQVESALVAIEKDEDRRRDQIGRLQESVTMLAERIVELRQSLQDTKSSAAELVQAIEEMKTAQQKVFDAIDKHKEDIAEIDLELAELREKLMEIHVRIKDSHRIVAQAKIQLHNMEKEKQRIETELGETAKPDSIRQLQVVHEDLIGVRRLLEDYQDVSEAVAHTEAKLSDRFQTLIAKSAEIQDEVNEAEVAVQSIKDQYHNEMNNSLSAVETKVNSILDGIDFPGEVRFNLIMKDGKYGVEFKSRIKGDKFGEISAGSGGERSLIAIGLILALQQLHAAPIYAFDEIDTFLDATNTELVGQLLHNSSLSSQFILFTPAKSTYLLRHADKILGVAAPSQSKPSIIIESPKFVSE